MKIVAFYHHLIIIFDFFFMKNMKHIFRSHDYKNNFDYRKKKKMLGKLKNNFIIKNKKTEIEKQGFYHS